MAIDMGFESKANLLSTKNHYATNNHLLFLRREITMFDILLRLVRKGQGDTLVEASIEVQTLASHRYLSMSGCGPGGYKTPL